MHFSLRVTSLRILFHIVVLSRSLADLDLLAGLFASLPSLALGGFLRSQLGPSVGELRSGVVVLTVPAGWERCRRGSAPSHLCWWVSRLPLMLDPISDVRDSTSRPLVWLGSPHEHRGLADG